MKTSRFSDAQKAFIFNRLADLIHLDQRLRRTSRWSKSLTFGFQSG